MSKLSEWQRSWECKLGLFKEKLDDFVVTMPIYIPRQKVNHIFCNIFSVIAARFIERAANQT